MTLPANIKLADLRRHDPEAWQRQVRAALREARSIPLAAAMLNVPRVTLHRWIRETPQLTAKLTLPKPGRPPEPDDDE